MTDEAALVSGPVPVPAQEDLPYWEGLRRRELVLHRCDACGALRQRAELLCGDCGGESFTWTPLSGRGTLYSYAVARRTWVRGFDAQLPYVIVAVSVAEWPALLLTTNLVGEFDVDGLELFQPVRAAFEERGEWTLLQFELDR